MPLKPFVRLALAYSAVAILAASVVASCETAPPIGQASSRPDPASDASVERVILQAYRVIGDRHLDQPDFRRMSVETFHGFALSDPQLSLRTDRNAYTVLRGGTAIATRPAPADPADGSAWGIMLTELFAASLKASPMLQQTDRELLIKDAMVATTKQLDKNSRYADPEEARDNRFQRDGGGGIGITVERTDDNKIMIRATQPDSPSSKAGVQPGDQILAIDGESMVGRPLIDVIHKLRGAVGAPVSMTVLRTGDGRELTMTMQRMRIIPTTVAYERHDNIGLIHLTSFNTGTTEALDEAIEKARRDIGPSIAGIIIDMRSNRGGLLDQAETVTEEFIGDGVIFSTQGRHPDSRRTYRSDTHSKAIDLPIVVLVNGNSASAAEIVAAALQDRGRAAIVGTTSYGKGTVQTVIRLPNRGELVLTWSRLMAPSGYTWNELGVMPNICTAKVGDLNRLGPASLAGSRTLLQHWHAERNPSPTEVADLRKICPPGEDLPERDIDIASRLLRDPSLYAQAVRSGSIEQAAAPAH